MTWDSFPNWWVDELPRFSAGADAGRWMSALRVYLALALLSDFHTREASASWSDIEALTGLSRPMVLKGIRAAEEAGLIIVDRAGHSHRYTLFSPPDKSTFAKIPRMKLRSALPNLPRRGYHALDALKLYILLVSIRKNDWTYVPITHRRIVERTGIQPSRVRAAADVLFGHGLIHLNHSEATGVGRPHNLYHLLGLDLRRPANAAQASTVGDIPF